MGTWETIALTVAGCGTNFSVKAACEFSLRHCQAHLMLQEQELPGCNEQLRAAERGPEPSGSSTPFLLLK